MGKRKHLPLMGVGPIYVIIIVLLTAAGVLLKLTGHIRSGTIAIMEIPFISLGILLIIAGCIFWIKANFQSKLDYNIKRNILVTTGVYAYVRNPIYSAFMMICTGILLVMNNLWLLILPVIYWFFMTVLMKSTEEKWLRDLYGQEYVDYCKQVNRCIPYFKR